MQESATDNTEFMQEIYETRWRTYRSEQKRCRKKPTEEAVHDLRVATRRLLALIELLRVVAPHPRLQKLRTSLKDQLAELNELRDTQVMLIEVSESLVEIPDLKPFQKFLKKREKRLLHSTVKAIKSAKQAKVKKRMNAVRKKIFKQKLDSNLDRLMLKAVDEQFETVMQRYQRVDPTIPASIHHMRVAFKKFRYMIEIVRPLIPKFPKENIVRMHDYQDMMGSIQDTEVLLSALDDFAKKDASYAPEPARRFYQQRHSELIDAFIENMQQVDTFWRPAPDSPFPWESGQSNERAAEAPSGVENDESGEQVEAEKDAGAVQSNFSVQ